MREYLVKSSDFVGVHPEYMMPGVFFENSMSGANFFFASLHILPQEPLKQVD